MTESVYQGPVKQQPCPACKAAIGGATSWGGSAGPGPGDLAVCLYCAAIITFDETMTLRLLRLEDMRRLERERPDIHGQLRKAQLAILRGRSPDQG